jgi:hypothetical protein
MKVDDDRWGGGGGGGGGRRRIDWAGWLVQRRSFLFKLSKSVLLKEKRV